MHSTMPSVTCLRLSDVSVMCRVTYFQFSIQSAFLPCLSTRQYSGVLVYQYRTSEVAKKLDRYLSCTERTSQGNDFELILTVKMDTRHPVEGSFGSEFRVICNHCVLMAACSRKTLTFCKKFLRFLEKRLVTVNFLKFCSQSFHHDTDGRCCVSNFVKFGRREVGEIVRYSPDKIFRLPTKLSLLRESCLKSARVSPQQCTQSAPDFL